MKTKQFFAKSNKLLLKEHSFKTAEIAKELLKHNPELADIAYVAGLLHDIGKAESQYQRYILDVMNGKLGDDNFNGPYHNEVGWAYLAVKGFFYKDKETTEIILNVIYWHHGVWRDTVKNERPNSDKILDGIDVNSIDVFAKEIGADQWFTGDAGNYNQSIPEYIIDNKRERGRIKYSGETLEKLFAVRSAVVAADRINSADSEDRVIPFCDGFKPKPLTEPVPKPEKWNSSRFDKQQKIIQKAKDKKVSQINAPAGFGKTIIGLGWILEKGKKGYWVTPRNDIARGVYLSIVGLLKTFEVSLKVELVLANKRQESYGLNDGEAADLTITNIDNYIAPVANMNRAELGYEALLKANVVFDEYHEFAQKENALYAAFIYSISTKIKFGEGKVMMLSATPSVHSEIIKRILNQDVYEEEDEEEEYEPAHSEQYNISIIEDGKIQKLPETIQFSNTIKDTIQEAKEKEYRCYHSKFTKGGKKDRLNWIYSQYGKGGKRAKSLSTAPILQASHDVSATSLVENVLSPEATLQRIGRCNRWGEKKNEPSNLYLNTNKGSKGNVKIIDMLYDKKLNQKWKDFIKENLSGIKTLKEVYDKYKNFNKDNKEELIAYYQDILNDSLTAWKAIVPTRKHSSPKTSTYAKQSDKANLRSSGTIKDRQRFVAVWSSDLKQYLPYIVENGEVVNELSLRIFETKNDKTDLEKAITNLVDCGYDEFRPKKAGKYTGKIASLFSNVTHSKMLTKYAKSIETPYPLNPKEYVYSNEYGLEKITNDGEVY